MDPITQQTALASAGGKKDPLYVDDVFSTTLYNGNSSTQTINNGIDLAGEGGMVWSKSRSNGSYHSVYDTETSLLKWIRTDDTAVNTSNGGNMVTGFTNNGYTIGNNTTYTILNTTGRTYVSWTFRKAPGFFDVVTYTGNGSTNQTFNHSLGSVPGMILIKNVTRSSNWLVWVSDGITNLEGLLNEVDDFGYQMIGNVTSTTVQTLYSNQTDTNRNGDNYVAYLFASDDAQFGANEDESIIKCGSYTGSSANNYTQEINLGFEPQWLMVKASSSTSDWHIVDTMRGFTGTGTSGDSPALSANVVNAEPYNSARIRVTHTGFKLEADSSSQWNSNGTTYIYMAIRRPNKPPEAATDVFAMDTGSGSSTTPTWDSGFTVDFAFTGNEFYTRLTGGVHQKSHNHNIQSSNNGYASWDSNLGWGQAFSSLSYMFRRAPGFMDVVLYKGNNNTAFNVNHNLGVAPELVIIKDRDTAYNWLVGSDALTAWGSYGLKLNTNDQENTSSNYFTGAPTSTQIKLGTSSAGNYGTDNFIAYLFATLPGISKVGSFTGTGNTHNIDCGFTNGARFIMIKRVDSVESWYYWDTSRGITSGNDPYRRFDVDAGDLTSTNYINPLAAGFTINLSATARINGDGATYLFLAIA